MEPKIGQRWRTRDGGERVAQIGIVVWVASDHIDLLIGSGGASVPLATFLASWVPIDEDEEATGRHG